MDEKLKQAMDNYKGDKFAIFMELSNGSIVIKEFDFTPEEVSMYRNGDKEITDYVAKESYKFGCSESFRMLMEKKMIEDKLNAKNV